MQEGTVNFIALVLIASLPNPFLKTKLPLGLLPIPLLESITATTSTVHSNSSNVWTPGFYQLRFSVPVRWTAADNFRGGGARLESGFYTLWTHLLLHMDSSHLFNNVASIAASALFLDMGFVRSGMVYLVSGMGGACALMLEKSLYGDGRYANLGNGNYTNFMGPGSSSTPGIILNVGEGGNVGEESWISAIPQAMGELLYSAATLIVDTIDSFLQNSNVAQDILSWFKEQKEALIQATRSSIPPIPAFKNPLVSRSYIASGCSAAVFGFVGVEIAYICKQIHKMSSKRYSRLQRFRAEQNLANLALMGLWKIGHVVVMLEGVYGGGSGGIQFGGDSIGHSAHFGGFLTGLLLAPLVLD